jgi:hypothetical protein
MPVLPNPRHGKFAQVLARGKNATEAHKPAHRFWLKSMSEFRRSASDEVCC